MASQSVTNFTKWMKEQYWPKAKGGMEEAFYRSEGLLGRLQKKDASGLLVGKQLIVPVHKSRTFTGGPRSESGTLPTAAPQGVDQYIFSVTHRYWPISITGPVIDLSKGPTAAFANALDFEVRNATRDGRDDMNRSAFQDGSGSLARIPSGASSATQTVDDTRFFEGGVDQPVSIVEATTGVIVTAGATHIHTVNHTTKQIVLHDSVNTGSNTCVVCRTGGVAAAACDCFENDIWGIQYIVHDGTVALTADTFGPIKTGVLGTTFAGVATRGSYPFACSSMVDGSAGITEDLLMRVFNKMRMRGGNPSVIITSEHQWRAIGAMLHGPVVWNNFVKNIDFGYKALSFQGVDIIWEPHCPPSVMYILDEDWFYWGEVHPLGFMDYDGQSWVRASTTDAINAQLVWRGNIICTNPYPQVKVYGLPSGTTIFE